MFAPQVFTFPNNGNQTIEQEKKIIANRTLDFAPYQDSVVPVYTPGCSAFAFTFTRSGCPGESISQVGIIFTSKWVIRQMCFISWRQEVE